MGANSNLDIQNCVLVGGHAGIVLDIGASGTINNNTMTGFGYAGFWAWLGYTHTATYVWSNIITNSLFGLFCTDLVPDYVDFNDIYDIDSIGRALYCPG